MPGGGGGHPIRSYGDLARDVASDARAAGCDLEADIIEELLRRLDAAYADTYDVLFRERERHTEYAAEALGVSFDPRGYFVYLIYTDDTEQPAYVGRSRNILSRLGSHRSGHGREATRVSVIRCKSHRAMCVLEEELIKKYQPARNIVGIQRAG